VHSLSDVETALNVLVERAFHRSKAVEASSAISRVREEQGGDSGDALSYEVVIPPEGESQFLLEKMLPRLVYFLECHGSRLPVCSGVFART
jgi:hypothetical protein